jgi:hypothetical protein
MSRPLMPGSRPSRSTRPLTTESPALRMGDLRRVRALVPGEVTGGEIRFQAATGALMLMVEYVADMRESGAAWIRLRHHPPGEPPASPYGIDLGRARCCCPGGRWAFRCPVRRTFSGVLYNPMGTDRFLSSRAHGMRTLLTVTRLFTAPCTGSIALRPAWRLHCLNPILEVGAPAEQRWTNCGPSGTTPT